MGALEVSAQFKVTPKGDCKPVTASVGPVVIDRTMRLEQKLDSYEDTCGTKLDATIGLDANVVHASPGQAGYVELDLSDALEVEGAEGVSATVFVCTVCSR